MSDPQSPMSVGTSYSAKSVASSRKRKRPEEKAGEEEGELVEMIKANQQLIENVIKKPQPTANELFGQSVGLSLDKMSEYDQELAKFKIQQILFQIRYPNQDPQHNIDPFQPHYANI